MEFYSNHSKVLKSSNESDKDLSNIFVSKFESNDSIKEQSFKISIDRNNNKHVLSPLGLSQGPRGIKVSRLSLQCSESSIRHSLIQQFGIQNKNNQNRSYNIRSIVLESAAGPSPTRWAIVTFTTSYDAEKALQMALKSQSVELHPGYDLFDYDDINLTTNCPQGLDEFHPKASRTLQISNLPLHLNNFKTLYEYFSKLGKVLDIEIKPKLVLHASALIQFSDISKVVKILVSPRAVLKCLVGSSITSSTSFQFGPSFPTNCIWLGQISNSINENQITEYFSRFGHVLEVVQDIKQQKALVYLDNAFAAQQSIIHLKRKNSVLGTCRVQVDYASLECQATISYWLSNNFPTLPVPPETVTPKQPQSDNSLNNSVVFNRCASRINSNQEKLVLNINKSNTNDPNPQNLHICVTKSSELPPSNILSNHDQVNYTQPTISIKNYPNSVGNSGLNISEMVITERIQTDNTTRVTPICNKRSNNIRVTNPYDSNCDTTTNNRFLQNYEPAININSSHMNQTSSDYQNQSLMNIKKERNYTETNNEGKILNNIRLSCSPVTWSTNTTTSQTSDINKSDIYNGQFSPWSAPVRNRVVARVDPFSHTSSNTHNSSQANANLLSKTIQNSQFANRVPNAIPSHNVSRNIQRTLSSISEKDLNATIKPENFVSINKNLVHSIDREFGNMKRKTNYNQPLTYRIAKNPENIQKPFDNRTPIYSSVHKIKTLKNFNYKTDISEISNKPITAAEVFGEDFSDLSDSDSASSFVSNNRKRKQKLSKCKSPSVDSSSTISVLSSEKQNRFIRVSKVHYHTNKKLMHLKPKRLKNRLDSNKCSSENVSSDEACSELHNSNLNRSKMKISIKDKSETMNSSMKPLTVNVSLSNFEDNPIESDELSSPITDNSSVEIPKRCLNIKKNSNQLLSNKRKISGDKSIIYRNDNSNLSSSSDNEQKNFKRKYKINSSRKSKSFHSEYDERKRSNSYAVDRRYKENKYVSKISDSRSRKMKFNDDHHSKTKLIYNSSNYEKDNEKNSFLSRHRQDSDSPPIKHKKIRHEEIDKANIYRTDKKLINSSFSLDFHSAFKRHEYQQLSQEISSDAVFQKEFDEFKRDQASDQSSVHRKGNSSKVSSASSIGVKTFSSYEKYKAQKPTKSSKITNVYTTSPDCKNIFQIDMNNINMYESMYDKVKRRAQKQAETKINHNSPEINEPRNKRKNKMLEHKHKTSKENKVYYKRHKKSRDMLASPTSTVYSDDSSVLVDDSQSNYSSTRYVISEKDKKIHNRKIYKSTKNSTVSSFESPNSFSATNWKRSKNKNEMLRIFKYSSNKMHEIKYFNSKKLENDYENDNEEHESISEFSFKTNTSNINFSSKPVKEFTNGELEEVANVSDATASTEPMEYAEVDLESLKMSDDDWKSGLSSQSSSESGNNMTKIEMNIVELSMENTTHTINEIQNISDKPKSSNFVNEDCSDLKVVATKRDFVDNVIDSKVETFINSSCNISTDVQLNENKEVDIILTEVNNHECVKEEQDIAIASIMLKEESDSKSPIDWKSNIPNDMPNIDTTNNSIKHIFDDSCNKENITNSDPYIEIDLNNDLGNNSDLNKNNILESSSEQLFATSENVTHISDPINSHVAASENLSTHDQLEIEPIEKQQIVPHIENCNTISVSPITAIENNKVTEIKSMIDPPVCFNEIASIENSSPVISVNTARNNKPVPQGKSNNTNEKIDLTSYVKGVIEQVKREQNAENQNKLKLEKNSNKRIKKIGNCNIVPSKNSLTPYNSMANNLSVSLLTTFQKSPTVSLQAAVIETSDAHTSSYNPSSAPNIPGVNVCSPVTNIHLPTIKPILETTIASLPDILVNKPAATRPNVISIINISSGTALKSDHTINNSVLSELKVNTELNTIPTSTELHSAISDQISTQLSNNSLKSPISEDHAKQRICTRLRRADPSKADSNYKIVTTTCVTRADFNTTNNNYNTKVNNIDHNKVQTKHNENIIGFVSENMSLSSDKISDPYEPNFDESPLEYSRYQTKSKTAFFPNDNKTSKEEIGNNNLKLVSTNTINATHTVTCSGIDSVSQIIEDVVHGNFNYSDYLTSFKNGKLSSFQISPSTTPLTFVSNDSRDCSSVSADNMNNINCETVSSSYKKHNASLKLVNNVSVNIDDIKKTDVSSNSNNKPTVALLASIPASNINLCNLFTTNKTITQKETTMSNSVSKSNNQNSNISVFNSNLSQTNQERLTFINLYKPKEKTALKTNSISLEQHIQSNIPISSFQLQSYNRDLTSNLTTTCTSPFEKETAKVAGNFDQNLPITISKNNLLNINVNSSMPPKNINPLLSTVVHSQEENHVLKTYLNILQRSNLAGINSSTLSKLQNVITDLPIKDVTSQCDSNTYRNIQNINQLDTLALLQNKDTSEESVNSNVLGNSPNIFSRSIADLIIPRMYPLIWEGKLSLKNEEARVALHFVHGNTELLNACMHLLIFSGSLQWNNTGSLKIVQRMRLDMSQLEGVQRRMQNPNEYCIGLALPGGDDINQWMKQSQILKEGFIKYMREKGAAGIINVCHPENNQQGLYVVHIFPPCEFSTNQLLSTAPDLHNIIEMNKFPNLLVVITTV